jgi:hypothetical protein
VEGQRFDAVTLEVDMRTIRYKPRKGPPGMPVAWIGNAKPKPRCLYIYADAQGADTAIFNWLHELHQGVT